MHVRTLLHVARFGLLTLAGMTVLTVGMHLCLRVGAPLGLGVVAVGELLLMALVLDELIRPMRVGVTGFLKVAAAAIVVCSAIFTIGRGPVMLLPFAHLLQG